MTKSQLDIIEAQELRTHKIRTKSITFQELVKPVLKSKKITYDQFLELDLAARVSNNFQDSLLLNKLTVLYPIESLQ